MRPKQWEEESKCSQLTARQSDELFYPPKGGKSNRAKIFCSTCPVQLQCLEQALENKLEGFFSGTTMDDREAIRTFKKMNVIPLALQELPGDDGSKVRTVYRKVFSPEDVRAWMDEDIEPDPLELLMIQADAL